MALCKGEPRHMGVSDVVRHVDSCIKTSLTVPHCSRIFPQTATLLRVMLLTACIINGAVAPYFQRKLVNVMKSSPYALSIDDSSDNDLEKVNAAFVTWNTGRL